MMRRNFNALAAETGDDAWRHYHPRWLRASFVSAVRSRGIDERLVKHYIGHSTGDILGRHYEQPSPSDFAPLLAAISDWSGSVSNVPRQESPA